MKKLLSLLLLLVASANSDAAENLYEKSYQAQNTANLVSLQANPDTQIFVSKHQDEDNISMLEHGYDLMGASGFDAGKVLQSWHCSMQKRLSMHVKGKKAWLMRN